MANMRISGIMSGFDTDTMIKDLMKAESARVDKVKQNRQYTLWQQEGFREIINKLKTFQSNYFDVLKSNQNMTSASSFAKFTYAVKSGGVDSSKVTVIAGADVKSKSVTIDSIDQLALKDKWTGNTAGLRGINTDDLDITTLKATLDGKDFELSISLGSNGKLISVNQAELALINSVDELKTKLNEKITAAFGSDYSNIVTVNGSKLKFDFAGTEIKILKYGSNSESMTGLFGVETMQSSNAYQSKSLKDLFGLTNTELSSVLINGKPVVLDETDTISGMQKKINGSEANILINYDTLQDRFVMSSKAEGSANNIIIDDESNAELLFEKLFNVADLVDNTGSVIAVSDRLNEFGNPLKIREEGVNAKLSINGTSIVQSNNTFTLDGMTYTIKETSVAAINIAVTTDTTSIIENIKNFVKEYNDIVDFINGKLSEKRDYDFDPLTDEEKEALSDEDIVKWETKAKAGNLRGSSELSTMLSELRNALIEPIEGVGLTMSQIGISSTSYTDKGKLNIDETKLKSALENKFEDVVTLFTKKSSISYNDSTNRNTRDSENGIASRFEDIIKDNIRITRDSNGNKGKLIMKVGIENDASQFSNEFQKKITGYDDRISDLLQYLTDRESYYYTMFSRMESALSQMESQSASLMSQLGSS